MGYELSEDQLAERDRLWSRRNDIVNEIEDLLRALADATRAVRDRCEELVNDYNQNLADMVGFAEDVANDVGEDDYPDFYRNWNEYNPDDLRLYDLNVPDPDEISRDPLDDDINDLPTESDE